VLGADLAWVGRWPTRLTLQEPMLSAGGYRRRAMYSAHFDPKSTRDSTAGGERNRRTASSDDSGCLPQARLRSPKPGVSPRRGRPTRAIGRKRRFSTRSSRSIGGPSWRKRTQQMRADAACRASWWMKSRRSSSAASWPTDSSGFPATPAGRIGWSRFPANAAGSVRHASGAGCATSRRTFATMSCPTCPCASGC
jgi:hypothetical protein